MPLLVMPEVTWVYRATVVAWMDGDTLDAVLDTGFTSTRLERLRLRAVDTPERTQSGWKAGGDFSRALAPPGTAVVVRTYKPRPETFGRYVADVWIAATGEHVGQALIRAGLARRISV